jgi:hypothetical protein
VVASAYDRFCRFALEEECQDVTLLETVWKPLAKLLEESGRDVGGTTNASVDKPVSRVGRVYHLLPRIDTMS